MSTHDAPVEANAADPTQLHGGGFMPADPAPLGLTAFGLTTFVLSMLNANLVGKGATDVVLPLALATGGLAQFAAGMWEFRRGNTFGAVAFTAYGTFWLSIWYLFSFSLAKVTPTEVNAALGLFLWAWTIFTVWMTICALRTTAAIAVVFILLTITFLLLAIGNSGGNAGTIHLGGYFGLATAAAALYTAFAAVINETWGRAVLPVIPLGG